jgi:hypothetical protein
LIGSAAAQGENVDTMLILGSTPNVIDATQRMRNYSSLSEVANDFGTTAPEYLAANIWFSQHPQPISVNIGFWAKTAVGAQLVGGSLSTAEQNMALWTPISAGAFMLQHNGVPVNVTGVNFAGQTNLNGVASQIQTALAAAPNMTGASMTWNTTDDTFRLRAPDIGLTSTLSFLSPPTANGSVTFSAQPANLDTLTINGTVVTFVTAAPVAGQVQIGVSLAQTMTNLVSYLNASSDIQLVKMKYNLPTVGTVLYITSVLAGVAGNAYTLARTGASMTLSGATLTGGAGVDISDMLNMRSTSDGAYTAQGASPETALQAVQIIDDMYSNQWYGLAVLGASDTDVLAVAGYVEAANIKHYYTVTDQSAACLTSTDTTSLMYRLGQLSYDKTSVQYSSTSPYAGISYLARILTTNWEGNNTAITLMYKVQPGVVGESLSTSQLNNIRDKNGNVFILYNNQTTIIQDGKSISGQYTDTIIGADWYAIQLQTDVYNLLYTTPTKIPQTDQGMNMIHAVLDATSARAVNNGFLAPGTWTLPGFGVLQMGQYLPKGYYIYQPPIALQSPALRQQRISVPFQIAAKLAGAVHEADISVTINQ